MVEQALMLTHSEITASTPSVSSFPKSNQISPSTKCSEAFGVVDVRPKLQAALHHWCPCSIHRRIDGDLQRAKERNSSRSETHPPQQAPTEVQLPRNGHTGRQRVDVRRRRRNHRNLSPMNASIARLASCGVAPKRSSRHRGPGLVQIGRSRAPTMTFIHRRATLEQALHNAFREGRLSSSRYLQPIEMLIQVTGPRLAALAKPYVPPGRMKLLERMHSGVARHPLRSAHPRGLA